MKTTSFYLWWLAIITALLLTWCSPQEQTTVPEKTTALAENQSESLQIVTTFPPLYAHTANIIDENDTLTNLVPPGTSVHTWQPKPSDILAMENADIIVTNGLWLEEFLTDYLETLENKWVLIVDTSAWVDVMEFGHKEDEHEDEHHEDDHHEDDHHEDEHHEDEHEDDHDAHNHEWPDPHIWLDPNNAKIQVATILEALIEKDSSQDSVYTKNAETYTNELTALDLQINNSINEEEVTPFIVFHDAYQYFLQAYNLQDMQVGLVQEFHGDNPSQKQIAGLMETIKDNWVTVIYTEPQFNPNVVQRLKQETWVTSKEIDPIGSSLSKTWYIDTLLTLAEAFK